MALMSNCQSSSELSVGQLFSWKPLLHAVNQSNQLSGGICSSGLLEEILKECFLLEHSFLTFKFNPHFSAPLLIYFRLIDNKRPSSDCRQIGSRLESIRVSAGIGQVALFSMQSGNLSQASFSFKASAASLSLV